MLKKALYFLFTFSLLAVFNGYAMDEDASQDKDVGAEVTSNDSEMDVADNAEFPQDKEDN